MGTHLISGVSLEDKIILISGSSRGIGYWMAKYFAEMCGSIVIVCSRHMENAKKVSEIINGKTYPIELDVTNNSNIDYCICDIIKKFGKIDILINNAGYRFDKELWYKNCTIIHLNKHNLLISTNLHKWEHILSVACL